VSVDADPRRERRLAIAALVLIALLFVVEMVALALGRLEIALAVAAIFTLGWLVLRSRRRRLERR
jgi:membrane protease YdiL (CAAX protease family)